MFDIIFEIGLMMGLVIIITALRKATDDALYKRSGVTTEEIVKMFLNVFNTKSSKEKIADDAYFTPFKTPQHNKEFESTVNSVPKSLLNYRTILQVKGYNTTRADEIMNIVHSELTSIIKEEILSEALKIKFVQDMFKNITKPLNTYLENLNNQFIEAESTGSILDMSYYDIELEVLAKTMLTHLEKIRSEK